MNLLWHFATGYLPDFLNKQDGPVGWCRWSHRGVQCLEKMQIPRKQRPYIFSPRFELRFNNAFEQVLRACADTSRQAIQKRSGQTWITPDLMAGLIALHRLGYAHSFETWEAGTLVGGIWGVQIGGLITMSSMFNRVSNASKCAMARTMLHLRQRGFELVDMGMVPDHLVHFGAEWLPRWKYEAMLPRLLAQELSLSDEHPPRPLPWQLRLGVPMVRLARGLRRRIGYRSDEATKRRSDEGEKYSGSEEKPGLPSPPIKN